MTGNLIRPRKDFNTRTQGLLSGVPVRPDNGHMAKEQSKFKELLEAAARPYRELWKGEQGDQLNLGALARRFEKKGYPLSEASLSRIFSGVQEIGPKAIDAAHFGLGIPKNLLRGEPMSAEMEKLLTDYKLTTLLLAKRLEDLPKEEYYALVEHVERVEERERRLREAMKLGNVTHIDRAKR